MYGPSWHQSFIRLPGVFPSMGKYTKITNSSRKCSNIQSLRIFTGLPPVQHFRLYILYNLLICGLFH